MRKQFHKILVAVAVLTLSLGAGAQTTATFDDLTLSPSSYWDGSAKPLGTTFRDGHGVFPNYYDTSYGGFWSSGWAYSDMKDSTTAGAGNVFSSRAASGYSGSANYAVGQQDAVIRLDSTALGKVVNGVYVDNGTYAALSMKHGDTFAKKFGDTTGTDCHCAQGTYPDWFKLTIRNWYKGSMGPDSVTFYLADYRFGTDTAADYIVSKWTWVDLTPLGNTDSLLFALSSSDNGMYGMNTPAFFCVDNFTTANSPEGVQDLANDESIKIYPNPTADFVNFVLNNTPDKDLCLKISDLTGRIVYSKYVTSPNTISVDMSAYSAGTYFAEIVGANTLINKKIVKE